MNNLYKENLLVLRLMFDFLFNPVKEGYKQLGISIYGSYYVKAESLRNRRISVYVGSIFLFTFFLFTLYGHTLIDKIVKISSFAIPISLLVLIFAPVLIINWRKTVIEKVKNKLVLSDEEKINLFFSELGKMFGYLFILILITTFSIGISLSSLIILLLEQIDNKWLSLLLEEYNFRIVFIIITLAISFFMYFALFNYEKNTRAFEPKLKPKLKLPSRVFLALLYLISNMVGSLLEFFLVIPLNLTKSNNDETVGCVLGKVSFKKAERRLRSYGLKLIRSVPNPRFIRIFNGYTEIHFWISENPKLEFIDFGDYMLIKGEDAKKVKNTERLLDKEAVVRRWKAL